VTHPDPGPEPVRIHADVDREDRLLADLTARQVAILAGTGALLWLAFMATRRLVSCRRCTNPATAKSCGLASARGAAVGCTGVGGTGRPPDRQRPDALADLDAQSCGYVGRMGGCWPASDNCFAITVLHLLLIRDSWLGRWVLPAGAGHIGWRS
jgi:hypothetical protein